MGDMGEGWLARRLVFGFLRAGSRGSHTRPETLERKQAAAIRAQQRAIRAEHRAERARRRERDEAIRAQALRGLPLIINRDGEDEEAGEEPADQEARHAND